MHTEEWLEVHNVYTLPWLAQSPDLNPIENMCGILAREVYRNQRQYTSVEDLEECVYDIWHHIKTIVV